MEKPNLRVVFLVGSDNRSTRQSIEAVCRLPGVKPVGILLDTEFPSLRQRRKSLFRNIRENGWLYPVLRVVEIICEKMSEAAARAAVPRDEVRRVLEKAFPEASFSLAELAQRYGMTLHAVGSMNSLEAIRVLGECRADLGIVLGTRILKPGTFNVPRLGSINLHKGKVPEYRGMPPGFWELYDGVTSAGVTVHFVDKGLDTGDIIATGSVPILKMDTPDSLLEKLHGEGTKTLARAVGLIRDGDAKPQTQEKLSVKPRSKPAKKDIAALHQRLPHWKKKNDISMIARNLYSLLAYYSGVYFLARQYHRLARSRSAIILHHRVNDYSKDVLTVDPATFAAQLLAISKHYPFSSTVDLVERILSGKPIPPTTIAIHFDDCYRDVVTNGAPILRVLGIPACAFINSGFVNTDRSFAHDVAKYPFTFEMLRSSDVRTWNRLGFEVGAHTVNHADLGTCPIEDAEYEIAQCGQELERLIETPVRLFSFPFGKKENITPASRHIVQASGYTALFSAHGGFISSRTDPFDIPRMGANYESAPIYCLLQIEGLTLAQIGARIRGIMGGAENSPGRR